MACIDYFNENKKLGLSDEFLPSKVVSPASEEVCLYRLIAGKQWWHIKAFIAAPLFIFCETCCSFYSAKVVDV